MSNLCIMVWNVQENLGLRIWNLFPDKLKQLADIHVFKEEVKKWKPENCPCRLCKTYIPHVGFI